MRPRNPSVYCSYSEEDEILFDDLREHLERKGFSVAGRHEGATDEVELDEASTNIDIFLLLVSPDFLASDYCYNVEVPRAMEYNKSGTALVMPVILRPVDWKQAPFGGMQKLPREGDAITTQADLESTLSQIAEDIWGSFDQLFRSPPITHEDKDDILSSVKIFISYAPESVDLLDELILHLRILASQSKIEFWHSGMIAPGMEIGLEIEKNLNAADFVLALIGPEYLSSEHLFHKELEKALTIDSLGTPRLIPVVLRPVDLASSKFSRFQVLPRGGRPVTSWAHRDEAWVDVARGIENVARNFRNTSQTTSKAGRPLDEAARRHQIGDIFCTSGTPELNYEPPDEFNKLKAEMRILGRGLAVEGPSGIGKTSAMNKALDEVVHSLPVLPIQSIKDADVGKLEKALADDFDGFLIIDDFHHLPDHLKDRVARAIKLQSEERKPTSKICVIGINRVGHTLMEGLRDLAGHIEIISMHRQPDKKIEEVVRKGERQANITFGDRAGIVEAADGSFFVAQSLCYHLALHAEVLETELLHRVVPYSPGEIVDTVINQFEFRYRRSLNKFASLDSGSQSKGAGLALLWLLRLEGVGYVLIEEARRQYPQLGAGFDTLAEGKIVEYFEEDEEISDLLYYDPRVGLLALEDPRLSFYLRHISWVEFATRAGHKVEIESGGALIFKSTEQLRVVGNAASAARRFLRLGRWASGADNHTKSNVRAGWPWWVVALVGGVVAAIATVVLGTIPANLWLPRLSLIIGILVAIFIYYRNPRTRYMRGFLTGLSILSFVNIIPSLGFEAQGFNGVTPQSPGHSSADPWTGFFIRFLSEGPDFTFNLVMGLILVTLLVLDSKERSR